MKWLPTFTPWKFLWYDVRLCSTIFQCILYVLVTSYLHNFNVFSSFYSLMIILHLLKEVFLLSKLFIFCKYKLLFVFNPWSWKLVLLLELMHFLLEIYLETLSLHQWLYPKDYLWDEVVGYYFLIYPQMHCLDLQVAVLKSIHLKLENYNLRNKMLVPKAISLKMKNPKFRPILAY